MSELIYPGIVKNDHRVIVTDIDEDANVVTHRWYLSADEGPGVGRLVKEYQQLCYCAENLDQELPHMWGFLQKKSLKLYLCPWCDN
jgi:hypothetical protein